MTLRILPAGAIAAGVHRTLTDATLEDLVDTAGADGELARAEFAFALDYDHANGRLTRIDLTVRLTIDMPEWPNSSRRPQAEQDEWDRFLRALRVHEDGHIAIFRREAATTYRTLQRSRPGTINDALAREEERINRLSVAYDHRTGHGRTQQTPHGTTEIQVP
jgi:predicted secreted Zn-dependent protease